MPPTSGTPTVGSPDSISPTISTPRASSPNTTDAAVPNSTATSEPGTNGNHFLQTSTTARLTAPTNVVSHWMSPRWVINPQSCWKKSPSDLGTPRNFGTWPMRMVNASPTMNPFSTGSEMNDAMKPSRNIPASRPRIPVTMASAAVSATYSVPSPPANGATLAADSAAVADIGPTTRCRELPAAAYRTSDGTAAYRPTAGGPRQWSRTPGLRAPGPPKPSARQPHPRGPRPGDNPAARRTPATA